VGKKKRKKKDANSGRKEINAQKGGAGWRLPYVSKREKKKKEGKSEVNRGYELGKALRNIPTIGRWGGKRTLEEKRTDYQHKSPARGSREGGGL